METMNPSLAVCIPTYCNHEYIELLIDHEIDHYCELGFSLYIFDSSPDDDTFIVVDNYKKEYKNLFYYKFSPDIHSNEKVYNVFQMAGEEIECDYLWVRSDALLCDKVLLYAIKDYLKKEYDYIYTIIQGKEYKRIFEINDRQSFFEDYAWRVCLYGAAILNVKTVLSGIDWDYMTNRYLDDEKINFSHVCLYFEQMSRKSFNALVIDVPEYLYYENGRKKQSSWRNDSLELWLKRWPAAINSLPDIYKNKIRAIRAFGSDGDFFKPYNLKILRDEGVLDLDACKKYKRYIESYSGVSLQSFTEAVQSERNDETKYSFEYKEFCDLSDFCTNYSRLVIYGCGKVSGKYADYMMTRGILFDAFIVSDDKIESQKMQYKDHLVVGLSQFDFTDDTGVILGLNRKNQLEIKDLLKKKVSLENVFSYPFVYKSIIEVDDALRAAAGRIKSEVVNG